jgi:hypothetical protein
LFFLLVFMRKPKTHGHFPLAPGALYDSQVVHQHGGEQGLGGIGKAGDLPDEGAPDLRVGPEVWRDMDGG